MIKVFYSHQSELLQGILIANHEFVKTPGLLYQWMYKPIKIQSLKSLFKGGFPKV